MIMMKFLLVFFCSFIYFLLIYTFASLTYSPRFILRMWSMFVLISLFQLYL